MKLTTIQESEFIAFEKFIKEFCNERGFGLALKIPFVDRKIEQLEELLEKFMKEDGMIDGKKLGDTIHTFKPDIANWINFPRQDFRMVDLAQDIIKTIFGN